ncbi:protein-export chaperone SecB [Pectobacterium brasiliense]|uniref:protein-export chaperone SecB n=1 Tax=Pectobacterium brasiliense TaxID=180957 RepID=UPI0015DF442C|nr:protein-export chaperone SecB [Pectobacterium brasiliense]MBA0212415.1 protein-export chaperone SecB [Pectobacterium brasiliense]
MKLKLRENKVKKIILDDVITDNDDSHPEHGFSLEFTPSFDKDGRCFSINFNFLYLIKDDDSYHKILKVNYCSTFNTDGEITDEFISSKFPVINAPAIAFPFLRAFVANFLLSSGYNPILLPSINFTRFENDSINAD